MDGLDASVSLDSTFEVTRGGASRHISYREYYGSKTDSCGDRVQLLAQDDEALVIHHKFVWRGAERRIEDTIHFVPQLLHVVPVEQHNDGCACTRRWT